MNILKQIRYLFLYFCTIVHTFLLSTTQPWSWYYVDTIKQEEKSVLNCTIAHEAQPFTQLIFSWNANRPKKGWFTLFVQARDTHTHTWSSWHKAIEWGRNKQISYTSSSDGIASYEHVRFEVEKGKKCDAFRVRVLPNAGASIKDMHRIAVSCSDFTHFVPENIHDYTSLSSVHIKQVPKRSQFSLSHPEKERLCSPTSCAMIVAFLTKRSVAMSSFASQIYDPALDTYGNWAFNMAHAHTCVPHIWFCVRRLNSFKELHAYLLKGFPVVVSVRGTLAGAPQAYNNGHLLVVIGYDAQKKKVLCHDPAFKSDYLTFHAYDLKSFLRAWECSRRLAYCLETRSK